VAGELRASQQTSFKFSPALGLSSHLIGCKSHKCYGNDHILNMESLWRWCWVPVLFDGECAEAGVVSSRAANDLFKSEIRSPNFWVLYGLAATGSKSYLQMPASTRVALSRICDYLDFATEWLMGVCGDGFTVSWPDGAMQNNRSNFNLFVGIGIYQHWSYFLAPILRWFNGNCDKWCISANI